MGFEFDLVVVVVIDIQKRVDVIEYHDFVVVSCWLIQSCFAAKNSNPVDFGVVGIADFLIVEYFSLAL